jgi:hypothetical protein
MSRGKFGCLEKGLKDVTILILGLPLPREVTAVQRWTFTFFRARLSGTQIGNGISLIYLHTVLGKVEHIGLLFKRTNVH